MSPEAEWWVLTVLLWVLMPLFIFVGVKFVKGLKSFLVARGKLQNRPNDIPYEQSSNKSQCKTRTKRM